MKIGITFFGSKLDLLCISKVLPIFRVFSKIRLKRKAPGDTWRTRRVPGVGGSRAGALGELPGGGSRGTAHSESSREGLSGFGHAGHVAGSGASGVSLPAGVLGDRCRVRRLPGQLSLAGLATHSGASGRLAAHSELPGTRGAFGGIRSKYHSRGSRRTRVLPGGLRRTRSLPVTRGAFAGFQVLSLAGLHGALGDRWHVPQGFPTGCRSGLLRRRL